jgi:hypothetical protein
MEHAISKRTLQFLVLVGLLTGASAAVNDPFVGKWKLDPSKSRLTDEMKVEAVGTNKYAFDFGGGEAEIVRADGTDQPGNFGTTLSVIVEEPNTWKVVRKKNGRTLITGIWKLSEDDKTLHDNFTGYQPNGSSFSLDYVYQRTAGTSGFAGTWESTSEKVNSAFEIEIRPYADDGLTFVNPAQESTKNIKFDGRDYPDQGPNVAPGSESSGRRVNERSLEIIEKTKSKVLDKRQVKLSPDLKTLTMTVQPVDRTKPNVLVFDRE